MKSISRFVCLALALVGIAILTSHFLERNSSTHEHALDPKTGVASAATVERKGFFRPWGLRRTRASAPQDGTPDTNALYQEHNAYAEPRSVMASNAYHSESITSMHRVNTNALVKRVHSKGELLASITTRLGELGQSAKEFRKGQTKTEVIKLLGEEPAARKSLGNYNYFIFSPHPERSLPDGVMVEFSFLFVWFDEQDRLKDWWITTKVPLLPSSQ